MDTLFLTLPVMAFLVIIVTTVAFLQPATNAVHLT